MGYLIYGHGTEFEFDDRTLAHLKAAVSQKLRKQESFFISWTNPVDKGSGRVSMWVSPEIPLVFRFSGSRAAELNPVWLDVLCALANGPRGLVVVSEQEAEAHAKQPRMAAAKPQLEGAL